MKRIIKETKSRSVLSEGRNQGIGFAMLKKLSLNNYETVNPISPCKDYLNEVIFTENTGIPTKAYGLVYDKPNDIFKGKKSYLVFMNQKQMSGNFSVEYKTFEAYSKEIDENYKNIELFINNFQIKLGGFLPCKIRQAEDKKYLVIFDTKWCQSTYSISLFTLLLRVAKSYKGEDIIKFLTSLSAENIDKSLINTALPKIKVILDNKKLPTTPKLHVDSAKKGAWTPHNLGICSWNEKYE